MSSNRDIWLGILIGYKCIELLCGLFLAFETRNVKIEELNESKFIGFCIYTIIVTVIALVPVGVFVSDQTIWYAITGLAVMAVIIVILSLIFIPKVRIYVCIYVYNGRNIYIQYIIVYSGTSII